MLFLVCGLSGAKFQIYNYLKWFGYMQKSKTQTFYLGNKTKQRNKINWNRRESN